MASHHHFKLIDMPRPCDHQLYSRTIEKIVTNLSRLAFVESVYQVGRVRHPGISDIDLLVVVEDAAQFGDSPFDALTDEERYLFTHSCFLIPESLAPELATYILLGGYHRLHGTTWPWQDTMDDSMITTAVQQQTAMEFLVKNLLDLFVQVEYRVIKVRALLQHLKGLHLDLALLQVTDGPLRALVDRALALIDEWFETRNRELHVLGLVIELLPLLRDSVDEMTRRITLYCPRDGPVPVAANMTLDAGSSIELRRMGVRLPSLPILKGRRHFNAQHRVNRFRYRVQMRPAPPSSYHAERFEFQRRAKSFASAKFPAFSAPIPPLFYYTL